MVQPTDSVAGSLCRELTVVRLARVKTLKGCGVLMVLGGKLLGSRWSARTRREFI